MEEKIISLLLDSNGYIITNKTLIRKLGLYEAVIIGELISEYNYWRTKGLLEDDMFYSTAANISYNTSLSEDIQRRVINKLKELDIITVVRKGLPARNYFKFNFEKLNQIFEEEISSGKTQELSSGKTQELKPVKFELNNNKQNNNKQISNNITNYTLDKSNIQLVEQSSDKPKNNIISNNTSLDTKQNIPKKLNRYESCYLEIEKFTEDKDLRELLDLYLQMRLEMKDKPIYRNQWKGLLNKLRKLSTDKKEQKEIIQYSLDRGYASFYELKTKEDFINDKYDVRNKPWNQGLSCEGYTDEELKELKELEKEREANGIKTKF